MAMLRKAFNLTLIGLTGCLVSISAMAGNGIDETGKHTNINIIGHPNADDFDTDSEWGGGNSASSGGGTIFIPLVTEKRPRKMHQQNGDWVCTDLGTGVQTLYTPEPPDGLATTTEPVGNTRIYFDPVSADSKVLITDRDATDGEARVNIPVGANEVVTVRMYVRVLGKPGGCAEISGYALEEDGLAGTTDLWWYAGSVDVQRKKGKSEFVDATDIFSVVYCDEPVLISADQYDCDGQTQTLSVFDPKFLEYFWEVNNYKTKLVQLRFYYD
jgi:hypothetical protein